MSRIANYVHAMELWYPAAKARHTGRAALQGPFTYEALRPEEINFVPLKQKKMYQSRQLLEVTSLVSCL